MTNKQWPRSAIVQYTNAELRNVVRHRRFYLMTPQQAKSFRMMAYGVLLERKRGKRDRRVSDFPTSSERP